jgi:hypothetical protein
MRAMNLLPVEERGGARSGGSRKLNGFHALAGTGSVVVIALLGTWAMAKSDEATAQDAEAAAVARSAVAQAEVNRLQPVVALDTRRQTREAAVLTLAAGRTDWAMVLRSVAGSLPSQVSVTTLGLKAGSAAATGGTAAATPAGLAGTGSVAVAACADTQPRVATALRRLRALPQVEDVALNQTSRTASGAGAGASAAGCTGVSVDAALGLSAATIIDAPSTAATTAADAGGVADATTTTSAAPQDATAAASTSTGANR